METDEVDTSVGNPVEKVEDDLNDAASENDTDSSSDEDESGLSVRAAELETQVEGIIPGRGDYSR